MQATIKVKMNSANKIIKDHRFGWKWNGYKILKEYRR
jgi:hypothetical protein